MCHGQMLSHAMPQARKPLQCSECRRTIPAGRVYDRSVWVESGEKPWTSKLCRRCLAILREASDDDGCAYGDVRDIARERATEFGWRAMLARLRSNVSSWRPSPRRGGAK